MRASLKSSVSVNTENVRSQAPTEALFKEARRRQTRRRLIWAATFVFVAALVADGFYGEHEASVGSKHVSSRGPTSVVADRAIGLFSCSNSSVFEPKSFVISCADGNTMLTKTHWTRWTSQSATGVTDFAINLCDPSCFASRMSIFSGSTVRLTDPVHTRSGMLYSQLVVDYRYHGEEKTFSMDWNGDPTF